MKKLLFLFFFSLFLKGDFLEEMQKIDLLLQSGKLIEALELGENLSNENITDDEKIALDNLLKKINEKINISSMSLLDRLKNNTGEINFATEEVLESESSGTISYAGETINDASNYSNYLELEKQILETNDDEYIYSLVNIYMKEALYEKAMKLALKSNDIRNIYISAFAARLIGKYDISISQYQKILSENPNHLNSLLGIANAYRYKKDYPNAIKYFNLYISNGGTNPHISKILKSLNKQ